MLATLHFLSEQVFGDSYLELLTLAVLVSGFLGAYRHLKCHRSGCHRLGRFQHGHMKLCAVHHPLVPSNGRIGHEEIAAVTHAGEQPAQPRPRLPGGAASGAPGAPGGPPAG